jgi:hypothetical protein
MRVAAKLVRQFLWIALLASIPTSAYAQATIAGIVRDTSGAVLPGVTVEAASPALIEKVRSAVTDDSGQFQIVNLVPGTYSVTFTLPGFNAVTRAGVELSGTFAAKIDAELRVGSVEETITVTGESPIVDVRNTTRQSTMDREIIDEIPTSRTAYDMAVLIPGVSRGLTSQDVGGTSTAVIGSVSVHGSRGGDQVVMRNGIETVGQSGSGFSTPVNINPVGTQEVNVDTASAGAEHTTGGVRLNVIPREGGNRFNSSIFASYMNPSWQGDNLTQELRDRGVSSGNKLEALHDINPGFGGPLKQDRLWFFVSARYSKSATYASGMYYDKNANNPNVWVFEPDLDRPAINPSVSKGAQLRLTFQANQKNKFGVSWHEDSVRYSPTGVSQTRSPEAAENRIYPVQRQTQLDWSSPISSRVLLEAGINRYKAASNLLPMSGLSPLMVPAQEQSTGLLFRSLQTHRLQPALSTHKRFSASYITGTHAVKIGMNHTNGWNGFTYQNLNPMTFRLNNAVPNQISQRAFPIFTETNVDHNMGIYAQDKWTIARLTAAYGVRYSYVSASSPEQHLGPGPFTPTRNLTFAANRFLSWHDLTPHLGAAYDVFGTGRTAVKVSLNRYLENMSAGATITQDPNPLNTIITQTTRSWNDANRNYVPECDLVSPLANGECGAMANSNFGQPVPGNIYDPELMFGWGKRGYNWEVSTGVQHEVMTQTSVDVSYFRRVYGNSVVTDNLVLEPGDIDRFDVTAPADDRLPGGGGYVVHGAGDLNPAKFGLPSQNFKTLSKNYGDDVEYWHGVDFNFSMRSIPGLLIQGGTSTGRTVTDNCEILAKIPEPGESRATSGLITFGAVQPLEYCHSATNWLTQVKLLGSYTIPRIDVRLSGTLQSLPGPPILASFNVPSAVAARTLGRPLSGGAANSQVGLLPSGTVYGERLNQVDLRLAKLVRIAQTRTTVSLDFYNALNASTVLSLNNTFGSTWQRPTALLTPRFAKVSVQFDF